MFECIKEWHCPVGSINCCDICPLRNECQFVCTDSNCEVRKKFEPIEAEIACSFSGKIPGRLRKDKKTEV